MACSRATTIHGTTRIGTPSGRSRALALLLVVAVLSSGCIDTVFPQPEEEHPPPEQGLLRIWVAATRGSISKEYAHYNVSFGGVAHARDILLDELVPLTMQNHEVDLVKLERERKAVEIARGRVPDGEYFGFAFYNSGAVLGVERIVGSDAAGNAITRVEEREIPYNSNTMSPRAAHAVIGGRVTDLYLEVDLQRSLQIREGTLHHMTIPSGVAFLVDGVKVAWRPLDGGLSMIEDPDPDGGGGGKDVDKPPTIDLEVRDEETGARAYWSQTQPNKRMSRSAGLGEDLVFDASRSLSRIIQADPDRGSAHHIPIVEHTWDFGDGEVLKGATVTKNYTQGGVFDVSLTVRDSRDNVARDHMTLFVPYTPEQAVKNRSQSASGELLLGQQELPVGEDLAKDEHTFTFPADLENGSLTLGGYSVRLVTRDPLGGNLLGLQSTRLDVDSAHFQERKTSNLPIEVASAGIPAWRGPLKHWVRPTIDLEVQLMTGIMVQYDLEVEAHYYYNLSRGLDPHAAHIHGSWPFGPAWEHLEPDGRVHRDE